MYIYIYIYIYYEVSRKCLGDQGEYGIDIGGLISRTRKGGVHECKDEED